MKLNTSARPTGWAAGSEGLAISCSPHQTPAHHTLPSLLPLYNYPWLPSASNKGVQDGGYAWSQAFELGHSEASKKRLRSRAQSC